MSKPKDDLPVLASAAIEGEFIPGGFAMRGTIDDEHSDESAPRDLRGDVDRVDLSKVDPDWIRKRLVAEACDFGRRSRQTARLKALELLGKDMGMFAPEPEADEITDAQRAARELSPAERRERIQQLARELSREMGKGKH